MADPMQDKNINGIHVLFFGWTPNTRSYTCIQDSRLPYHATLFYDIWGIVFWLDIDQIVTLIYNTVVILYKQSLTDFTVAFWVVAEPF